MGEEQKNQEEKKAEESSPKAEQKDEKKAEGESKADSPPPPPPPPAPQEIVLKVYMHCEGCARKVRRSLKGFPGVEDVQTDCKSQKVVVKGEKADPLKVLERVQRKSHSPVELLSPIPPPKPPTEEEDPKKPEENNEPVKAEEKKEEAPLVISVVLGVHMHCEACAQEMRKRILKMKGVESVEPDLKSSQVTVKGVLEPPKLVEFIHKRTGKQAVIVKVEPEKKEEEKAEEGKEEKKDAGDAIVDGVDKEAKKAEEDGKEKKDGGSGGGEEPPPKEETTKEAENQQKQQEEDPKMGLKKNEVYYYHPHNYHHQPLHPQRYVQELYAYPPQIFSDENPNACSVM